ncbi:MAG TPA: cob(I)yrinic acid a,c-diamide adenosyltransferase [Candidatus Nitrosopolaris rasttigaisensis]|jgi:cob(I)alamin adenosyltransferase|nr:cob(I)yrinic acid a,c-diamide adenosyltransferase [Candidatus Nitrosopolaris rasttigaisensis]
MKIYTKTGDKGETGLIGGKRISKGDPRIVAYGSVDELNSNIGIAISSLAAKNKDLFLDLINIMTCIQSELFIVGSDLADPRYPAGNQNHYKTPRTEENMASALEDAIDKFETELEPITFFILPGGSIEASLLHITRTIARRAEIAVTLLSKDQIINPIVLVYLNRLSDFLFVAARLINKRLGIKDIAWRPSERQTR